MNKQQSYATVPLLLVTAALAIWMMEAMSTVVTLPIA